MQALALDEDDIEFDDSNDGTVPDKEGFERPEIKVVHKSANVYVLLNYTDRLK